MTKKLYITHAMLKKAGACPDQRKLFCRRFPTRKVEINDANALRYGKSFSTPFLVNFLPITARSDFLMVKDALASAGLGTHRPTARITLAAVFARLVQTHGLRSQ